MHRIIYIGCKKKCNILICYIYPTKKYLNKIYLPNVNPIKLSIHRNSAFKAKPINVRKNSIIRDLNFILKTSNNKKIILFDSIIIQLMSINVKYFNVKNILFYWTNFFKNTNLNLQYKFFIDPLSINREIHKISISSGNHFHKRTQLHKYKMKLV